MVNGSLRSQVGQNYGSKPSGGSNVGVGKKRKTKSEKTFQVAA